MFAKFDNWVEDDGFLFISKYGLDKNNKIFIELSSIQTGAISFKTYDFIERLINKVDILCIKAGGRYTENDAKYLLNSYLIIN